MVKPKTRSYNYNIHMYRFGKGYSSDSFQLPCKRKNYTTKELYKLHRIIEEQVKHML